jgi:hypothetical protein
MAAVIESIIPASFPSEKFGTHSTSGLAIITPR